MALVVWCAHAGQQSSLQGRMVNDDSLIPCLSSRGDGPGRWTGEVALIRDFCWLFTSLMSQWGLQAHTATWPMRVWVDLWAHVHRAQCVQREAYGCLSAAGFGAFQNVNSSCSTCFVCAHHSADMAVGVGIKGPGCYFGAAAALSGQSVTLSHWNVSGRCV